MRPILSATNTYNYALAKWLDDKLKPLSLNQHTVTDIFDFVNEVRELKINKGYILVSYDVSSLFTNVPLDETIAILAEKAFRDNWFNSTYNLNISKEDLIDLLNVSTKGQFQFNGALYEQTDGVAMGSPLGPLLANVFMSSLEEKLELEGKLPDYYRRYVDAQHYSSYGLPKHPEPRPSLCQLHNGNRKRWHAPFSWNPAPKPCTPNRDQSLC